MTGERLVDVPGISDVHPFGHALTQEGRPGAWRGRGSARGHHGELLQGTFTAQDGRLRRGLTTLPCALFSSEATVELSSSAENLRVEPGWKSKARQAACATLAAVGVPRLGGVLRVRSNIEVGLGFGSSSGDVTATIRAVLDALGMSLPVEDIARIAVAAESAADPLMFDDMLLFAHREGEVIESFGVPLLPLAVLGFPLGIGPVDTLSHPPARYTPGEIEQFDEMRVRMRCGTAGGDLREIGRIATESATVNQRFLPVPHFAKLLKIHAHVEAVGIQVAHSGSVGSFLFDATDADLMSKTELAREYLGNIGVEKNWYYEEGTMAG
ncbi:GHMP kinase [Streptomyces xiamenensis]|uniref:GHMP family kinase ATP-binding protein n=1 Tax=Streptomyces xiamenensis TaxID=408015 RepID=UPI003431DD85